MQHTIVAVEEQYYILRVCHIVICALFASTIFSHKRY